MNAKLNEIHAAMALAGLDELDHQVTRNRERYTTYRRALNGLSGVRLVAFDEQEQSGYKNILIELQEGLATPARPDAGIVECGEHPRTRVLRAAFAHQSDRLPNIGGAPSRDRTAG